jgi:hypothetical protein
MECSWSVRHAVICANHVTGTWLINHERGRYYRTRGEKAQVQEGEGEKTLYYCVDKYLRWEVRIEKEGRETMHVPTLCE